MSQIINPEEQQDSYREHLKNWINLTNHAQQLLSDCTKGTGHLLRESAFSRTINNIPANKKGRSNLYLILATIHAFYPLSEEQSRQFLEAFKIEHQKDGDWPSIWSKILRYSQQIRKYFDESYQKEKVAVSYKKWYILFGISLFILLVAVVGFVVQSQIGKVKDPIPCDPVSPPNAAPLFNRNQGFSHYTQPANLDQAGLLSNNIRTLAADKHGIWFGYAPTTNAIDGISYYDGETWFLCSDLQLASTQFINGIAFLNDEVFFAVDNVGIARLNASGWRIFGKSDLPSESVYDLYVDSSNRLWATTHQGVVEYDPGQQIWIIRFQADKNGMESNHVHTIIEVQKDLWFGHNDRGISRLRADGIWERYYSDSPGLQNLRRVTADLDGGVWFATDGGGVLYFHDEQWQEFNEDTGFYSNRVQDIDVDLYGRIWVATDDGLFYTADKGNSWQIHSTRSTWDITFGCPDCPFDTNHIWIAIRGDGIGHVRIPPPSPTLRILQTPPLKQLSPGDEYVFEVEVQVMAEQLTEADGDSLRVTEPMGADLFGAYDTIPFRGDDLSVGSSFIFSNRDDPIIAPDQPGVYTLNWRMWQGRRFVTEIIPISFEVAEDSD